MHTDPLLWLLPAGILLVPLVTFAIILFFGIYIDRYCDKIAIMGMVTRKSADRQTLGRWMAGHVTEDA